MRRILIIPFFYLLLSVLTLSHYGINWDEPFHFNRGQAYLHYFLTGKTNFIDLPSYPKLKGDSDFMGREGESDLFLKSKSSNLPPNADSRRSYFQSDVFNFEYFIENDGYGHPPTNGILAALFNNVFYQKLGIVPDIEAYHLFELTASFLIIIAVAIFVYKLWGVMPSMVASLSLAFYPLFFAESHFNIKDPPLAAFFGLVIITFYFGIIKKRWRWLVTSAFIWGLALGTKLNSIFIPLIIGPWFLFYLLKRKNRKDLFRDKKLIYSLLLFPILAIGVFILFWPYIWNDPISHLSQMFGFYKDIGTSQTPEISSFLVGNLNLFPLFWIVVTTPLPILALSILGILFSLFMIFKKRELVYLLILLWLFVPIWRVSSASTAITGGVRQIMEFVPALAVISGIGVYILIKKFKFLATISLIFVGSFVFWDVYRLHPNENIYFNQLVGGLSGARERQIPFWGYSYGNTYLQGVEWINRNAPANAKLSLAVVNMVNIPRIKLRSDIDFSNNHLSGEKMQGEYVMEMAHNWKADNWYSYRFYNKYLTPVHEIKVDGVPIFKIWKNEQSFLKVSLPEAKEVKIESVILKDNTATIDLIEEINVTKLKINHDSDSCSKQRGGYIRLSLDKINWQQQPETIDYPQMPVSVLENDENNFIYLFTDKAKTIFLDTQMKDSCVLKTPKVTVYGY